MRWLAVDRDCEAVGALRGAHRGPGGDRRTRGRRRRPASIAADGPSGAESVGST